MKRTDEESAFDLNVLQVTDNIVAAIDPTFKRRFLTSFKNTSQIRKVISNGESN